MMNRHLKPNIPTAARLISTAKMKELDDSTDNTYEEAWFRLDPIDLKIVIRILSKSIDSLPRDEKLIIGQVIGSMEMALARSEKQKLRERITNDDVSSVLRAVRKKRSQTRMKDRRTY